MKGISKELPWPGSRCGWMEFYNRDKDVHFSRWCAAIEDAKMIEVCSTTLPQMAIPKILGDERFKKYREDLNDKIGNRSDIITSILQDVPQITFNETSGAFYNTMVFKTGVLKEGQTLSIADPKKKALVEEWTKKCNALDKRFVYYLLASTGVCVVPLSSFHSDLEGFRVTLLEEDEDLLFDIFTKIKAAILEYCES